MIYDFIFLPKLNAIPLLIIAFQRAVPKLQKDTSIMKIGNWTKKDSKLY